MNHPPVMVDMVIHPPVMVDTVNHLPLMVDTVNYPPVTVDTVNHLPLMVDTVKIFMGHHQALGVVSYSLISGLSCPSFHWLQCGKTSVD